VNNDLCKIPALAKVRDNVRQYRSKLKEQNHESSIRGKKQKSGSAY
jgi:sensor histidine kinase regulating citrate/malate metabolism